MIDVITRHEIQVLRRAGHTLEAVATFSRVSAGGVRPCDPWIVSVPTRARHLSQALDVTREAAAQEDRPRILHVRFPAGGGHRRLAKVGIRPRSGESRGAADDDPEAHDERCEGVGGEGGIRTHGSRPEGVAWR